ncbi:MAG: hypothetical protein WBW94_10945 [Anaerolineales bacterium]
MEITLSRKTTAAIIAALVLLTLAVSGYFAWRNGLLGAWLSPNVMPAAPSADQPAFQATKSFLDPNVSSDEITWEAQTCPNMTAEGCQIFKNLYASMMWNAAKSGNSPKVSLAFVNVAEKLSDGSQIWKLSTANTTHPWLYEQVVQDLSTQKWMLIRVLSDQEAQTRYGN